MTIIKTANVQQASEELIKRLMDMGVLYVDENGIHAAEEGVYREGER